MDLGVGFYVNFFQVSFPNGVSRVFTSQPSQLPKLQELRSMLNDAYVYQVEGTVYGYGSNVDQLLSLGFQEAQVSLDEEPRLAARLILDGFIHKLESAGFRLDGLLYGRAFEHRLYDEKCPLDLSVPEIKVLTGCSVRSLFLKDYTGELVYGLGGGCHWQL